MPLISENTQTILSIKNIEDSRNFIDTLMESKSRERNNLLTDDSRKEQGQVFIMYFLYILAFHFLEMLLLKCLQEIKEMDNQGKIPGRISTYSRALKQEKTNKQMQKQQGTDGGKETNDFPQLCKVLPESQSNFILPILYSLLKSPSSI